MAMSAAPGEGELRRPEQLDALDLDRLRPQPPLARLRLPPHGVCTLLDFWCAALPMASGCFDARLQALALTSSGGNKLIWPSFTPSQSHSAESELEGLEALPTEALLDTCPDEDSEDQPSPPASSPNGLLGGSSPPKSLWRLKRHWWRNLGRRLGTYRTS